MKTSDAAKGRWPEIFGHFGFQIIPNKHQACSDRDWETPITYL